jgi:hypothetical protein
MNQIFKEHEINFVNMSQQIENHIIEIDIIDESLKSQQIDLIEKMFVELNSILLNIEMETILIENPSLRLLILEKIKIYKTNLEILTNKFNYIKIRDQSNTIEIGNNIILVDNLGTELNTTTDETNINIRTNYKVIIRKYLMNIIFILLFLFGLFFGATILSLIILLSTNIIKIKN